MVRKHRGPATVQVTALKNKLKAYFRNQPEVTAVFLFGSLIRGEAGKDSDVDVAILEARQQKISSGDAERRLNYVIALSRLLNQEVDIVLLKTAPALLKYQILLKGECLLDKNPSETTAFKAKAIIEYLDFKHTEEFFTRRMMTSLKEEVVG